MNSKPASDRLRSSAKKRIEELEKKNPTQRLDKSYSVKDRRTGRTSKTLRGAQRRTILMSVLESLTLHLAEFTLNSVLTEVQSWWHYGESLFDRLVKECGLDPPTDSRLDKLVPLPKTA